MKQRITLFGLLAAAAVGANAQPYIPRNPDGGTYSPAWTYLPNAGQDFYQAHAFRADVFFSSVGTFPTLYALKHTRTSFVIPTVHPATPAPDSLNRFDFRFAGENFLDPVPTAVDAVATRGAIRQLVQ